MASGKKNYFRHSFNAIDDPKIRAIIKEMGIEGYGYYFSLLELAAKDYADNGNFPIVLHIDTIRKVWGKNTQCCKNVLT